MKTTKFEYVVKIKDNEVKFPLLSMARQYVLSGKLSARIICVGELKYVNGVEKK